MYEIDTQRIKKHKLEQGRLIGVRCGSLGDIWGSLWLIEGRCGSMGDIWESLGVIGAHWGSLWVVRRHLGVFGLIGAH